VLLLKGDGWRQSFNCVDVGHLHLME